MAPADEPLEAEDPELAHLRRLVHLAGRVEALREFRSQLKLVHLQLGAAMRMDAEAGRAESGRALMALIAWTDAEVGSVAALFADLTGSDMGPAMGSA